MTSDEYTKNYKKMLKSVYNYGGFWIGRYETGIEGTINETTNARTGSSARITIGISSKAISQKDAIPYNYVYCSEAQALAKEMTPDSNYTSSLMFGIQWDLVCKFLELNTDLEMSQINSNSIGWGNYKDSKIENVASGKYIIYNETLGLEDNWNIIINNYTKEDSGSNWRTLLSTGISEYTKRMNIYDFAGNTLEWTLERSSDLENPCSARGGGYFNSGKDACAAFRISFNAKTIGSDYGFRSIFYEV